MFNNTPSNSRNNLLPCNYKIIISIENIQGLLTTQKKKKHGDIIFNVFLKRICFCLRLMAVYIREIQKHGFRKKVPDFLRISFPKPSCPADWHENWLKKYLFFRSTTTTKKASRRRHWRFLELSETIRNRDPKRASVVHVSGKKVVLPSTIDNCSCGLAVTSESCGARWDSGT